MNILLSLPTIYIVLAVICGNLYLLECVKNDNLLKDLSILSIKALYNANNEATKARTEENARFQAGEVKVEDHKIKINEISEACDKANTKAEKEFLAAMSKLREKNPEGYRRSCY